MMMCCRTAKKAVALIMVAIFIAIAGGIGATLAMLISTEFQMGTKNYNVELAFYAADSGIARGKKILKDCTGWRPDASSCSGCSTPNYCSTLASKVAQNAGGKWYMKENFKIPRTAERKGYYRIFVEDTTDGVVMDVESGLE